MALQLFGSVGTLLHQSFLAAPAVETELQAFSMR